MSKNMALGMAALALFFVLYIWRLGTLTPGLSPHENAARVASSSFRTIIDNPLNAPHKIPQYVLQLLGYHGAFWMRSISVLFAFVFLACLYLLLRNWFGKPAAIAGTLLSGTTPWVVLTARNASPDIMMLSSISLIFFYILLRREGKYLNIRWFAFIISVVVCVYTPGLIWFLMLALIIGFKRISKKILSIESFVAVMGIAALILLIAPLGYAMVQNTELIKEWLGLPKHLPSIFDYLSSVTHSFTSLTYQMKDGADYAVGKFAAFSIVQTVLGVIGIVALWGKNRKRAAAISALLVIGVLVSAASNSLFYLTICLPAVAVVDTEGLLYLYNRWFLVFPINPLARWFALILITLVLTGQVAYGARYALLAWPHNMETRKTYVIQ
jgi:4-amino-4-deoxy-L-arabinose transferase-like glycosyltransferase